MKAVGAYHICVGVRPAKRIMHTGCPSDPFFSPANSLKSFLERNSTCVVEDEQHCDPSPWSSKQSRPVAILIIGGVPGPEENVVCARHLLL